MNFSPTTQSPSPVYGIQSIQENRAASETNQRFSHLVFKTPANVSDYRATVSSSDHFSVLAQQFFALAKEKDLPYTGQSLSHSDESAKQGGILPVLEKQRTRWQLLRKLDGYVASVGEDTFTVHLRENPSDVRFIEAEIDLSELPEQERPRAVEGAPLVWTVSNFWQGGTVKREWSIYFRRFPEWSAEDVSRAKEQVRQITDGIQGTEKGKPPRPHEVEVSVFGSGFGESIVAHLGLDRWIVIDSCQNPNSKRPVALEYLNEIGVNVPERVLLVVATHWDDDHIGGLAEVFRRAEKAVFVCPATVKSDEFNRILATVTGTRYLPGGSGADEMFEIMKENARRGSRYPAPKLAVAQKDLLEIWDSLPIRVQALSPSDAELISATERLRRVPELTEGNSRLRLPRFESNDASVVVSIQLGQRELILLGADLEERGLPAVGWQAVVEGWPSGRGRHSVFKVAHHGASNGHLDAAWDELLQESPWAIVTSFSFGKSNLPTKADCLRISARTKRGMITSHPSRSRYKDPISAVRRTIDEVVRSAYLVRSKEGHVRLRRDLDTAPDWICERFGSAIPIDGALVASL